MSRTLSELTQAIKDVQSEVDELDETEVSQADADSLYNAVDELQTSCDGLRDDVNAVEESKHEGKETNDETDDSEL